jgi:hypothetical protein
MWCAEPRIHRIAFVSELVHQLESQQVAIKAKRALHVLGSRELVADDLRCRLPCSAFFAGSALFFAFVGAFFSLYWPRPSFSWGLFSP